MSDTINELVSGADSLTQASSHYLFGLDVAEAARRLFKYLLEGFAVAIAAYYIPKHKMNPIEISTIALTAASVFAVLDLASPTIARAARTGAGFGIGMARVA